MVIKMTGWNPRNWDTENDLIKIVNEFWPDIFNDNRNRKMNITMALMADEIKNLRNQINIDRKKIKIAENTLEEMRCYDCALAEKYNLGDVRECQIIFTEYMENISTKCYKTQNEMNNCKVSQR
jgi:hypothetical protein